MKHNHKLKHIWTPELVAEHFREAISTMRKLPAITLHEYLDSYPSIKHIPIELVLVKARPIKARLRASKRYRTKA